MKNAQKSLFARLTPSRNVQITLIGIAIVEFILAIGTLPGLWIGSWLVAVAGAVLAFFAAFVSFNLARRVKR
jgi:uncharacterized membrane protein YkgB